MDRTQAIKRVLWVVLFLNLAVAAAKLAIGFSLNSLAMVADGFHSVLDGSSNVVGLVGMFVASRPPDVNHPYGHQKFEAFAALSIALLLGVTALEVVQAGIGRLAGHAHPTPSLLGFYVMGGTMAVNFAVSRYEARQGAELFSDILVADAAHTSSDIFVSLSVVLGLAAAWLEWYWLDASVAFLIAGLILYISYGILRRVSGVLTDTTSLTHAQIEKVVLDVPAVRSASRIRSRGDVPHLFIDMEIQLDPDMPLWQAHRVAHEVRETCMAAFHATDVVVHVEPAPAMGTQPKG